MSPSSADPARPRRQVTWFLPEPIAAAVDDVRARVDPVMYELIRPHVTVLHDAAAVDEDALRAAGGGVPPFTVHLGAARRWPAPDHGIYLEVDDVDGGLAAFRSQLGCDDTGYTPHVTLAHPRTVAPDEAETAWRELSGWTAHVDAIVERVHLIEGDTAGWHTVADAALG